MLRNCVTGSLRRVTAFSTARPQHPSAAISRARLFACYAAANNDGVQGTSLLARSESLRRPRKSPVTLTPWTAGHHMSTAAAAEEVHVLSLCRLAAVVSTSRWWCGMWLCLNGHASASMLVGMCWGTCWIHRMVLLHMLPLRTDGYYECCCGVR